MEIDIFPSGIFSTNAFLIASPKTRTALIIDTPPQSAAAIKKQVAKKNLKVEKILITHSHWDHIADAFELCNFFHCPIAIHAEDAPNLANPGSDGVPMMMAIQGVVADQLLKEGDEIVFGEYSFAVLHLPGHSPGSVGFYEKKEGVIFSGDVLFHNSIGNLALHTAQPERMWKSLEKLSKLPPETIVYPGHGDPTTIKTEGWLPRAREIFDQS